MLDITIGTYTQKHNRTRAPVHIELLRGTLSVGEEVVRLQYGP